MSKIALILAIVTVAASAIFFKTSDTAGWFAIGWIGGLAYSLVIVTGKFISSK